MTRLLHDLIMSNIADVLIHRNFYSFTSTWVHPPVFFVGSMLLIFFCFLCCVICSVGLWVLYPMLLGPLDCLYFINLWISLQFMYNIYLLWDYQGCDRMVVGFTTTYAISAYHHWCCEFESRSGRGGQHYVIKFVSDLQQVGGFLRVFQFPSPIKLTATI